MTIAKSLQHPLKRHETYDGDSSEARSWSHAGVLAVTSVTYVSALLWGFFSLPILLGVVLWTGWRIFKERRDRLPIHATRSAEIDSLYDELCMLRTNSPDRADLIETKFARLRELQKEEAAEMRKRFEASLSRESASSLAAIREAQRLLGRDEDSAPPDPALVQQG